MKLGGSLKYSVTKAKNISMLKKKLEKAMKDI